MIALVTLHLHFTQKFLGGGQKFIIDTINRIAKKEPIIYLPPIKEIKLIDDMDKFRGKLEKYNIILPERIVEYSKRPIKYEEMLKVYKEEIIKNDVRLIFDPIVTIHITYFNRLAKLKVIMDGISPFVNVCNDVLSIDAYCLSKITNKKLAMLYQAGMRGLEASLKYYVYGRKYRFKYPLELLKWRYQWINAAKLNKILKNAKVLVVSEGTLEEIPLDKNKYDVRMLEYALPIEEDIVKYRTKDKEDYLVFFARLVESKGVTELPFITKRIMLKMKDVKLYIIGKFFDKEYEQYIKTLIKKLNLENNIKFLGFLNDEDKYKIVSKAKLVIYPTHEDFYSYVILESIAVGTPVVSYALPGPYSVFRDLPAVRFINEFNIKGMANDAAKILRIKDEDYYSLVYNDRVNEFIQKRRGWDKVAEEIYSNL